MGGIYDYPEQIVPKPGFAVPFPFDKLKGMAGDCETCYRIKGRVDDNATDMGDGELRLTSECFPYPVHLSMNLMGGLFEPEHVRYAQKKPGDELWLPGTAADLADFTNCIEEIPEATPIFYLASDIEQSMTIELMFKDKNEYKSFGEKFYPGKSFDPNTQYPLEFRLEIKHAPTNLNYWHVQVEAIPQITGEELKDQKAQWRKKIYKHIVDSVFREKFHIQRQTSYVISLDMYTTPAED